MPLPIPRGVYPSVTQISPQALARRGIRLVLADLDNTLVPYKVEEPAAEVAAWARELRDHGIQLFLLSNSRKPGRAQRFAQKLDIPYQDTLGAWLAGVTPLLVEPIRLAGNPGRYIRYAVETPFRLLGKGRPFL